jgi:hypothetical protein
VPLDRARSVSTADVTRRYIDEHPSVRDALRDDLVNFAYLARKIQSERGLRNEEAIEIALRRYQQEMRGASERNPEVRSVLRSSRLEVRSRVALVRLREDAAILDRLYQVGRGLLPALRRKGVFQMFQGTQALTILCDDDLLGGLLEQIPERNVLHVARGLAIVALRSDPRVAETPGVLAGLAEALYASGINCLETVSVHTDSIFVFAEEDVIRSYAALSALVAPDEERSTGLGPPRARGQGAKP